MATNQDFDALMNRVEDATEQLEINVGILTSTGQDLEDAIEQTEQNRDEALGYAQQAEQSKDDALAAVTDATTAASNASQSASDALTTKGEVENIRDDFLQNNVGEAPKDGKQYARKDGSWEVVVSSGGGGGSVETVNNIAPDAQGNVDLPIPTPVNADWEATDGDAEILNKPTLFSGDYSDLDNKPTLFDGDYESLTNKPTLFDGNYSSLTNKPSIPTSTTDLTNDSGYIDDAPSDGKQYAREDGQWAEVEAGGGGANRPLHLPTASTFHYDGSYYSEWVNEFDEPIDLGKVTVRDSLGISYGAVASNSINDLLASWWSSTYKILPVGKYYFNSNLFDNSPSLNPDGGDCVLAGMVGTMEVKSLGEDDVRKSVEFTWYEGYSNYQDGNWKGKGVLTGTSSGSVIEVVAPTESGGGGGGDNPLALVGKELTHFKYKGEFVTEYPESSRESPIALRDCEFYREISNEWFGWGNSKGFNQWLQEAPTILGRGAEGVPDGVYYFVVNDFTDRPSLNPNGGTECFLTNLRGLITVKRVLEYGDGSWSKHITLEVWRGAANSSYPTGSYCRLVVVRGQSSQYLMVENSIPPYYPVKNDALLGD